MNQSAMQAGKIAQHDEPCFTPQVVMDFNRISHHVLRNFLHQSGLSADEYIAADVEQQPKWDDNALLTVEFCRAFSTGMGHCAENAEALLSLAALLDQRRLPSEHLRAVLPHWLINSNALACLFLGRALLRSNDFEKGILVLQQGLTLEPASGSIHRELGLALRTLHRTKSAISLLEAALGLRSGLWFRNSGDPYVPVLVNRPSQRVDIYFYKQRFYVVERLLGMTSPSVKVIGGELFTVRKNAAYRLARALLRLTPAQWLLAGIRERRRRSAALVHGQPAQNAASLYWGSTIITWRRVILQRIALLLFAAPIPKRTESILDAIELAREPQSQSEVGEAGHITTSVAHCPAIADRRT